MCFAVYVRMASLNSSCAEKPSASCSVILAMNTSWVLTGDHFRGSLRVLQQRQPKSFVIVGVARLEVS